MSEQPMTNAELTASVEQLLEIASIQADALNRAVGAIESLTSRLATVEAALLRAEMLVRK